MNPIKCALAGTFHALGVNRLLLKLQGTRYIRAINYHDVPPHLGEAFEAQLRRFAGRFEIVGPEDLEALRTGQWPHRRPGLLLSFDDGLRSHADVVAPALERHGFTGWFMVPPGFIDAEPDAQADYAQVHRVGYERVERRDPRLAMSWDDVRRLARRHVVGCHTYSHRRLGPGLSPESLDHEVVFAKRRLEEELGRTVDVFAWVGGEEDSYSAAAARAIRDAGFRLSFMTNNALIRSDAGPLTLQRTNIEAHYAPSLVGLSLSGFFDLMYLPKRRRLHRRLGAVSSAVCGSVSGICSVVLCLTL